MKVINKEHIQAIAEQNKRLTKESTRLHAQLKEAQKANIDLQNKTKEKLKEVIRYYDSCNEKVLQAICDRYGLAPGSNEYNEIASLYPIKIK